MVTSTGTPSGRKSKVSAAAKKGVRPPSSRDAKDKPSGRKKAGGAVASKATNFFN